MDVGCKGEDVIGRVGSSLGKESRDPISKFRPFFVLCCSD